MNCNIFPPAYQDYEAYILYYLSLSSKSAQDFISEVEQGIEFIRSHPNIWTMVDDKTRCYFCRHFPYGIYYRVSQDTISIGAILHLKRNPGLWKKRFS